MKSISNQESCCFGLSQAPRGEPPQHTTEPGARAATQPVFLNLKAGPSVNANVLVALQMQGRNRSLPSSPSTSPTAKRNHTLRLWFALLSFKSPFHLEKICVDNGAAVDLFKQLGRKREQRRSWQRGLVSSHGTIPRVSFGAQMPMTYIEPPIFPQIHPSPPPHAAQSKCSVLSHVYTMAPGNEASHLTSLWAATSSTSQTSLSSWSPLYSSSPHWTEDESEERCKSPNTRA